MNQGHCPGNKEKAVDRIDRDFIEEMSRPWQLEFFGVLELGETISMYIANIYVFFHKEKLLLNHESCLPETSGFASHHFRFPFAQRKETLDGFKC